jgi:hypothetical protein
VPRPRAADDFDTINERIKELRRETAGAPPTGASEAAHANASLTDKERRLEDRREGLPPHWVPTIFFKRPSNSEITRRFGHTRSAW